MTPRRTGTDALIFWSALDLHRWRPDRSSSAWLEHRVRHWLAFTLRSVLEQQEPDFVYWVLCDAALREHTEALLAAAGDDRVTAVYSDEVRAAVRSLPAADRYLVARLDSDDLYAPNVGAELLSLRPPTTEFLQFNRGYGCDVQRGTVRDWRASSSPFYCRVHGRELRDMTEWNVVNHTLVRPRATVLAPGRFLVTIHGLNTSSSLASGRGGAVAPAQARSALRRFGIGVEHDVAALRRVARGPRASATPTPGDLPGCVAFACAIAAPRRILSVGAGAGREAARRWAAHSPATTVSATARPPCDGQRHDVVIVDGCDPSHLDDALRSVEPSGLVVLAPEVAEPSNRWVHDRYREVERATAVRGRRGVRLLGRVIGPLS